MSIANEPMSADSMMGRVLLDRYRIVGELARGGMGIVYLARMEGAAGFVKPVVLKLILSEFATNDRYLQMFQREAQILSQLREPSIVDVLDFGEQDGDYIMVLEYVRGYHLGQWNRYLQRTGREVPTHIAIQIMIDVLQGLHHAHCATHPDGSSLQIVHRDVSPSNILLDSNGRGRLIDFGVAGMRDGEGSSRTESGLFVGKLTYTAPEVAAGMAASPRSDLYACGVVLHEVLLGFNTFRSRSQSQTLERVLSSLPESLADVRDDVPKGLDDVLACALAKQPELRYGSADAMAAALRELQPQPEWMIRDELADLVKRDFSADMANLLEIDSLEARDEAVRALRADGQVVLPSDHTGPRRRRHSECPPTAPYPTAKAAADSLRLDQDEPATPWWRRPPAWGALVALVIVAGAASTQRLGLFDAERTATPIKVVSTPLASSPPQGNPPPEAPDRPGDETAASAATPAPEPPIAASLVGSQKAQRPKKPSQRVSPRPRTGPDAASLTRAFRKQQGRIHACFKTHAAATPSHPRVDVDFALAANGKLKRVTLSPVAVNDTPLGRCLIGVAKRTPFPPQGESVSFTIPVTARRIRR